MKERITRRYLAGLMDGEGYLGIVHSKHSTGGMMFHPMIKLCLTTPEVLKEIQLKLGGHIWFRRQENPRWKDSYEWMSRTYVQVRRVLDYVHEYLIIKRVQADVLDEFLKTQWRSESNNRGSTPLPEKILEKRKNLYYLIRKLNYRGVPPAETERESSLKKDEATVRTSGRPEEAVGNYCTVSK